MMLRMKLEILYEDKDCLFINKPAGINVHGDGKTVETTIADMIVAEYPKLADVGEPQEIQGPGGTTRLLPKPGIVHRLDKETSGVMLIAKTQKAFEFFKEQFKEREIQKTYHCFVYGWPKVDEFEVDAPIGRDSGNMRKWTSGKGARGALRDSKTSFKVLKRFGKGRYDGKGSTEEGTFSFIEAKPKTGRTHQIRVHLRSFNHPIVSDSLYAANRDKELGFERLALHARELTVALPKGEPKTVEAPYPSDFEAAIAVANL